MDKNRSSIAYAILVGIVPLILVAAGHWLRWGIDFQAWIIAIGAVNCLRLLVLLKLRPLDARFHMLGDTAYMTLSTVCLYVQWRFFIALYYWLGYLGGRWHIGWDGMSSEFRQISAIGVATTITLFLVETTALTAAISRVTPQSSHIPNK